uniref:Uncharacterized protein n=1 Tax=Spongospora subterranea TaxID=70186 RepID=A0A0H5RE81_9EUKA|eukprot:CRZ12071.1 hypothetical protein [Spongospora subterranea]
MEGNINQQQHNNNNNNIVRDVKNEKGKVIYCVHKKKSVLTRDLISEPLHNMNWGFYQFQCQFNQHSYTKATRAYATQCQPDDPDDYADDGDEKRKESKRETQKKSQRPTSTISTAHYY